ncbi:MAG: hypothetical protein QXH30_01030 [Candidatus Bilamarchaeaceae archaeon]
MKGQVSNELLVVIGFILLLIIPLLYIMYFRMDTIRADLGMLQAHFSVSRIAFLINAIGYMGDGSAIITEVYVPPQVTSFSMGGAQREVVFSMSTPAGKNDIVQPVAFDVKTGPAVFATKGGGRYRVEIHNEAGVVVVSPQPAPYET